MGDHPRITVLYWHDNGSWISRRREFFEDESEAHQLYDAQVKAGGVPTLRPYHKSDEPFLVSRHLEANDHD